MSKPEEYFTIDGAYLRQQMRFAFVKFFAPFNPAYYRAIGKAEGTSKKFWTAVYWPEDAPTD